MLFGFWTVLLRSAHMGDVMRFKIDFIPSSYAPFALYWRKPTWFGGSWVRLYTFKTQADARELYEKIKDLPEYLQ